MCLSTTLLLIVFCGSHVVSAPPAMGQKTARITRAKWRQHPKIKAAQAIVSSVNAAWKRGAFKTSQRSFEKCGDAFTEFRRMTVDSKGVVRRYEFAYTAEDDSRTDEYYYDESGRLRFVRISGWNASAGSNADRKIYFDENGKRLWEDQKGIGHFWPWPWPDKDLHKSDAAKDFADKSRCAREVKPKSKRPAQRS